ncbi:MAG: PAS domain S-box protein [Gammaproteobacteria bacterium]|nr:PAS domain S-box protein [Gammaproteobacteria bacterium]MBQ0838217.1 PAS domain S-box protein [Gammaproteobacteria bacterium]
MNDALLKEQYVNELGKIKIESEVKRFQTLLKNKSDPLSILLDEPGDQETLMQINSLLALIIKREPAIHEAFLLSLSGKVLADVDPDMGLLGDRVLSAKELERAAILAGFNKTYSLPEVMIPSLGRSYKGSPKLHDGKYVFTMAEPVGSPVKAVLVVMVEVDKLWLGTQDKKDGDVTKKSSNYLVDRRGVLLTNVADSPVKMGGLITHLEIVRTALIDDAWPARRSYLGVGNEQVYGTLTKIPLLDWTLVSEVRTAELIEPIIADLSKVLVFTSLGMAIFIALVMQVMAKALKPIEHACKAIDLVAQGDYDFVLQPVGILEFDTLNRDITRMTKARKAAESALLESQQDLQVTLNSIGDAVIACDEKGNVTRMNAVAEQLTAWSIKEAKGQSIQSVFNIIDASTRETIPSPVEKVLNRGEIVYLSNHTTLLAKDGREYHISDSAAPIRDERGSILGMVLVFNDVTEAYHLREKASAAQRLLQELFDDMETMVAITNPDGVVVFANKSPLSASGVTLDEVLGKRLWECIWFQADEKLQAKMKSNCVEARAGISNQLDIQITTLAGLFWVSYSMHPVFDEHGEVLQILHEGRDVNERKIAEDELRASAQHLKLYREQTPLAAIEWSTDLEVIDWNAAAEEMFGYSIAEIRELSVVDILVSNADKAAVKAIGKSLKANTGGAKSTHQILTKDGRVILCEWHNTLLKDERGVIIGAASVVIDITAQQKAQHDLILKEREQSELFNCMTDGVISIDEHGNVLQFNKTAEALFGYSAEEMVGNNVSQLMPEPHASQHDGYLQRYLQTGDAHIIGFGRELMGRHKSNKLFPLRLFIAELPVSDSGERRFIGSCHDLTQEKSQEEQLRRSQKMDALGKLTGGVAHDFNNILGVVTGYADLLEGMLVDQPKLGGYAKEIHHAGLRGAKLTKKLLSFTRQETLAAAKIDINKLLLEQQDMLQKTLTVSIKLVMNLADELWPVWLDSSDLEDAVLNMSINAMHAMVDKPVGAQLTIRTKNLTLSTVDASTLGLSKSGNYVQLSLVDTGSGMDEATRGKIFDPFFSTKGEMGTGLGLSQVFGFVIRAGGAVKVYSEPGHGSEFALYFPRYNAVNMESDDSVIEDHSALGGSENILVVDDERALRELAAELLRQQGYRVFCADSGAEALKTLQSETIDLVLSDVIMPEMSGYQLAVKLKADYPQIKIQLASGFADEREATIVDPSLHNNMLHKPYHSQALFKAIRNLLDDGGR